MTDVPSISRRAAIRLLSTALALSAARPALAGDEPSDRGIGGTGIARATHGGEVGFVGTIRRFGSIYVNGDRITYPDDVEVLIDGRSAGRDALRIGQVVHVVAKINGGSLTTRRIAVESEVIGPIAKITQHDLFVLGQTVLLGNIADAAKWHVGQRIAVSGIRRVSGSIVASLIQPADRRLDQVVGPVRLEGKDAMLGGIRLREVDRSLVGRRVRVTGRSFAGGFHLKKIVEDRLPGHDTADRFSVEAYVQNLESGFVNGSGWPLSNPLHGGAGIDGEARTVLDAGYPQAGGPAGPAPGQTNGPPPGSEPGPSPGGSPPSVGAAPPPQQGAPPSNSPPPCN